MRYIPLRQETPLFSGPTALQMVLQHYGIMAEQKDIASRCGISDLGIDIDGLCKGARHYGLELEVVDIANYGHLERYGKSDVPVIVDWWINSKGHYSVVDDIDERRIALADPLSGGILTLERECFVRNWFDFKTSMYHRPEDLILRRMVLAYHP